MLLGAERANRRGSRPTGESVTSFIRITEIWIPSADKTRLAFGGGLYGRYKDFEAVSRTTRFAYDEGLPGKAWACRHPVVLKDLQSSYFMRSDAAAAAGLTCGIAIPMFAGYAVKAVLVLLCSATEANAGAIEVWTNDPARSDQLELADGYFGSSDGFEDVARSTTFAKGQGLPGAVWERGIPVLINNLQRGSQFVRWKEARRWGLSTGLGMPASYEPARTWITTLLSAAETPIARRFEVWLPVNGGLNFHAGACDRNPSFALDRQATWLGPGEGFIGRTLQAGVPSFAANFLAEPKGLRLSTQLAGLNEGIALPIFDFRGNVIAVVSWYS